MRLPLLALLIAVGCRQQPSVELPPPDPEKIMQWNELVRGMRMDLIDASGKVLRQRVPVLELRSATGPTIIQLWASYCPPCLEEMPMFDELYDDGIQVIGVSFDSENFAEASKVLAKQSPSYPQGVLQRWSMKKVGRSLANGLPFTVVLNRKGRVSYLFEGKVSRPEVMAAIERMSS